VLLRPLPYKNSQRLVAVWDREVQAKGVSKLFDVYRDLEIYKQHSQTLEQAAGATWARGDSVMTGHGPAQDVFAIPVSAGFFSLLGVPPALGRTFSKEDLDPIVGVTANEKRSTVYQEMSWVEPPTVYRPIAQQAPGSPHILIHTMVNDTRLGETAQKLVASLDPNVPVADVRTMQQILDKEYLAYPRYRAVLLGAFAALALLLAGAGVTSGLGAAWPLTRFLAALLYGVQATDPLILADVSAVLLLVSLLAVYIPAWRAATVDPMVALRYE
jgi:hypothetical protein